MTTNATTTHLKIRNKALEIIAATTVQPDLSEWETTIPGFMGRLSSYGTHRHGSWTPGFTAAGFVKWHCDGCHYSPPVKVRLSEVGERILSEWWDGRNINTASALVQSSAEAA